MGNTLIFNEEVEEVKHICQMIGSIVINTKQVPISNKQKTFSNYKNVILITTYDNATASIETVKGSVSFNGKLNQIVLVLVGQGSNDNKEVRQLLQEIDPGAETQVVIIDKGESMAEVAAGIAKLINQPEKPMPKDEFLEAVEAFLKKHNTCGLATGADHYVRCTPIEYEYENNSLYIITEGGNKFIGILKNPKVSVVVFEPYTTMAELNGLQIMGTAKLVEVNSKEYLEAFQKKGIKPETLAKLPIDMNVLKICPDSYEFLSSSFRAKGYDAKQCYSVE
ncbi:MAG: pyridoxamine 5'-phosphate oxidase family protein [bacterium]|nr:pyridoxamine 5'-phosphate oxidase family protein [bacterium]